MRVRNPSAFGSLLRHYRESCGFSQERLAEQAGLSLRGISDLERGARTTPRLETVRMLADGLGLEAADRAALLAARGSAADEPRPDTGRTWPGLPIPATPFIGRSPEIDAISELVRTDGVRLMTLIGPGGVGKTRIALAVAEQLANHFSDGAVFIDLTPVREARLVLPTIAARLGIPESNSGQTLNDVMAVALQHRNMLMILDNIEQVVDAAHDIAILLTTCPSLKILVTNRIVLRVAAEHVVTVDPLQLPESDASMDVSSLANVDAIALFVARAQAADARFTLSVKNADAVVSLVNRLDGLPLAIELAAARIRIFSPDQLMDRLQRSLPLLTGGSRDAPERQRTMRDAIAWSYDLLSGPEQMIFRWLSIFPSGCALEAAELVLATNDRLDGEEIQEGLLSLVDNSLLKRREGADGAPRLVMLQTVREFGLEQLAASGEEDVVRDAAHVAWYLLLARRADFLALRPDATVWLNRVGVEYENLKDHIFWLTERGRIDDALDISASVSDFRFIRGYSTEAREESEMLLAHPLGSTKTVVSARALIGLGIHSTHQGDNRRAIEALQEAIEISRELDQREYLAMALMCWGSSLCYIGRFDDAEAVTKEAHAIATSIDSQCMIAAGLNNLGLIANERGQGDVARELLETGLALDRSIGYTWGVAQGEISLAEELVRRGEIDQAERLALDARERITEMGDQRDMPVVYLTLANIVRRRGKPLEATAMLEHALEVARDTGNSQMIAVCLSELAHLSHAQGYDDAALMLSHDAMRQFHQIGDIVWVARCLDTTADIAIASGDLQWAAWSIGVVDGVMERHGVARVEHVSGEHQARVDALIAGLGEPRYRIHWKRGQAMEPDAILTKGLSWRPNPRPVGNESMSLSPVDIRILRLVATGRTDREIANELQMSQYSLISHTNELFRRLQVTDRVEAATVAVREGLVQLDV